MNLMAALKTVRRTKEAVKSWVDAVRINQTDLEEMEKQGPLMDRISQRAKSIRGQVLSSFDKAESLRELIVDIGTAGMALSKHGVIRPGRHHYAPWEQSSHIHETRSGGLRSAL